MKVGIVLYQNITYAPFLKFYESVLSQKNAEYEIIYFDRLHHNDDEPGKKCFPIKWVGKNTSSLFNKLLSALKFRVVSKRILSKRKYDYLFILTTTPGVLLADFLEKHYKKKYVVDIRDYTKEHIKYYFKKEKKLVSNSAINIVSSPDFQKFLPESKYFVCHNLNAFSDILPSQKNRNNTITISYIGTIQYLEWCNKLIDLVAKDNRFSFHFYGNEVLNDSISKRIAKLKNERIVFHGPFSPKEKASIYENSDLVFNCYGNNNKVVKYAISNKLYDAATFCKPLLVSPNTTMERISNGYAYALDFDSETDLSGLYSWYNNLNWIAFQDYCRELLRNAQRDNELLKREIANEIE